MSMLMIRKKIILSFSLFMLLLFAADMYAETIDRKTWEKETKDVSFFEENDEPEAQKEYKPPIRLFEGFSMNWAPVKYFVVALVIIAIAFVLFRIIIASMNSKNAEIKKSRVSIDYDSIDEHIHEIDLESLLDKNIREGNYNVAVRLQFLEVLKRLSHFNYIKWQKQKTNGEYLTETQSRSFYSQLGQFARIYEYVWFGSHFIGKESFHEIQLQYKSLMNSIGNNE